MPHPAIEAILTFFEYDHLHGTPRDISERCHDMAHGLAVALEDTPHGAELTTGLRKLLEAKDCFVRAALR